MEPTTLITIVVAGFAAHRLARFISKDSLWALWREKLLDKLLAPIPSATEPGTADGYRNDIPRPLAILYGKLGELIECGYCCGFWTSLLFVCLIEQQWVWELGINGLVIWWATAGLQALFTVYDSNGSTT